MTKRMVLTGALTIGSLAGIIGFAQAPPTGEVRASRHENLAAAQQFIKQAYEKIDAAQKANHSDLGGHAQKAKALLDQADHELGMAADVANDNHH